jgi:DNA modification methylase
MKINEIYNENCLDTMRKMPDNFIDLTVTSPPYDNLRHYEGFKFDFENIAKELYRVTKEGGVCVWVVGDQVVNGSETLTSFKQAIYFKEIVGFKIHDIMIFNKNGVSIPGVTHKKYDQCFEYMFIMCKGKIKTFNQQKELKITDRKFGNISARQKDGTITKTPFNNTKKDNLYKSLTNVWKINIGYLKSTKDKIAHDHPAIFPEKLCDLHILTWSNGGDLVYDPFMGSGTTAKCCKLLKRNYIGSEISEKYCEIIKKRIGFITFI